MKRRFLKWAIGVVLLLSVSGPIASQSGAKNGEWRTYGGDLGNTHYSPLDQIDSGNFSNFRSLGGSRRITLAPGRKLTLKEPR